MNPSFAHASEGVLEIDQTCAVQTGGFPVDAPGSPVTLPSGSYRLTSDLSLDETDALGIDVQAGRIRIEFAGIRLQGEPAFSGDRQGVASQEQTEWRSGESGTNSSPVSIS